MKALVLTGKSQFQYTDVEKPSPASDEVLIRLKACSICGSDIHGCQGGSGRRIPPIIMGHEASGIIEQLGEQVTDHFIGEPVTFDYRRRNHWPYGSPGCSRSRRRENYYSGNAGLPVKYCQSLSPSIYSKQQKAESLKYYNEFDKQRGG